MTIWRLFSAGLMGWAVARPTPPPPRLPVAQDADWVVTLNARRALWNDSALSDLSLGVHVCAGEALVWGPVISEAQAADTIARLRLIPGVVAVINETYILPADDMRRRQLVGPPKPVTGAAPGVRPIPAGDIGVRPIASDLKSLVEEVRQNDRRFRDLRADVAGGVVTVTGSAAQSSAALNFGQRVRGLPGVDRVILRTDAAP